MAGPSLGSGWPFAGPVAPPSQPRRGHERGTTADICIVIAPDQPHKSGGPPAGWPRTCSCCRALCCCRCCICVVFVCVCVAALSLSIFTRPASHIPFGRLTAWPPAHLRLVLAASTNYLADRRSLPSSAPFVYYHAYRFSCTCTLLRQPLRLSPSLFFYRLWTVDTDTTLANGCQPPPSHVRRRPR